MRNIVAFVAVAMLAACGPKVATLEVGQKNITLTAANAEQILTPVAKDDKGADIEKPKLTYTSSAPEIATVDATGKIVALKTGDAIIKVAASEAVSSDVPVKVMIPTSMVLMPTELKMMPGERQMLRARILDEKQREVPGLTAEWTSANPETAAVAKGVVTGMKTGATQITAALGALKATAKVNVLVAVNAVEVKGLNLDLKKNTTGKLAAVAKDEKGTAMENIAFTYTSSDPKVATVDPTGAVTAIAKGKTTVKVFAGGKDASADIVVK